MPKISVGECFIVALISVTEKVWRRGGGVSKISVKIFLCHSAENFRRGILQCCINFWRRGGGGYQKITSKCFCLTMPTKFSVVESFIVALILGIEKVWRREGGGGIKIFGRKFLPQSADENFRRRILYCCNKFGYRKKFGGEGGGGIKIFRQQFFVSQ